MGAPRGVQRGLADGLARAAAAQLTGTPSVNDALARYGSAPVTGRRVSLAELLRRPELDADAVEAIAAAGGLAPLAVENGLAASVLERVEIEVKYEGYLRRQAAEADRVARADEVHLPGDLDYGGISGLSREVVEKLTQTRPRSIGQASRISGVTPAAVSILLTHVTLTRRRRETLLSPSE